jgi:hypothetical protein
MNGVNNWLGVFILVIGSLVTGSAAETFADRLAALQSRLQSDPTNTSEGSTHSLDSAVQPAPAGAPAAPGWGPPVYRKRAWAVPQYPPSQDDVHDMSSLEEPISLSDSECNNASF